MKDFGELARSVKADIDAKNRESERVEQERMAEKQSKIDRANAFLNEHIRPSLEAAKAAFEAEGLGSTIWERPAERSDAKGRPQQGAELLFSCHKLTRAPGRHGGQAVFFSDGSTIDVQYHPTYGGRQGFREGTEEALEKALRLCVQSCLEA